MTDTGTNTNIPNKKPGRSPRQQLLSWFLRFGFSIALLSFIFSYIDIKLLKEMMTSPRWLPLLSMAGCGIIFIFLGGFKMWLLLSVFVPVRLSVFTWYFFLTVSIGSLIPAIFGDLSLIGLLRRDGIPVHQGVSALLVDRFITLSVVLFIFTPYTLYLLFPDYIAVLAFLIVFVIILSLLAVKLLNRPLLSFISNRFPIFSDLMEALKMLLKERPKLLCLNIGVSLLRGFVSGLSLMMALAAVNQPSSLLPTICIANSLSLISLIPVTIGGVGLYEGGGLLLFEWVGFNKEIVFAALAYQRINIILTSVIIVCFSFLFFPFKKAPKGEVT